MACIWEKVERDYTYTGMRQCIPTDTVQHYKQNGDPNGMINSTEIRPVLQDLSFINKLNEKSEHKATVKKKKKKKKEYLHLKNKRS